MHKDCLPGPKEARHLRDADADYLGYTEAESASMRIQQSYIFLHNDVYVI